MSEFGPNGIVMPTPDGPNAYRPDYAVPAVAKFKRIGLASFLCGLAACILVTLIAAVILFLGFQIASMFGQNAGVVFDNEGFLQGVGMAVFMSALNWYLAYFTIPAAWLAIAFSLGRFPRRGIVRPAPYYRWGAIWGGILVGGTTGLMSLLFSSMNWLTALGGLLTGAVIGALAGAICGAIFRGIVRPAEQVKRIQVEVF